MNFKKKLLILGSDFFTLQCAIEAKKMGMYVITSDLMNWSPTKEASDEQWMVSTRDIDGLCEKCIGNDVTAAICGASDTNLDCLRELCKRLNFPLYCSSDMAWQASRDKSLFKKMCLKNNVSVPQPYNVSENPTEEELSQIKFPVVVKPVDNSGNRGMSYCNNKEELRSAIDYAVGKSKKGKFIVERKLVGEDYHINYAVANGEIKLASYAQLFHNPDGAANIYSFEYNSQKYYQQYLDEINDSLISTFKELGCSDGVVWADVMRDTTDGKFYVLEMGYRFPSALASCHLLESITGFNACKWMVEYALGIQHTLDEINCAVNETEKKLGFIHYFTKIEGAISKIEGLSEIMGTSDMYIDLPKREGASVGKTLPIANLAFLSNGLEDMINRLKFLNHTFKIFAENGEDMLIRFTDYERVENNLKI